MICPDFFGCPVSKRDFAGACGAGGGGGETGDVYFVDAGLDTHEFQNFQA